MRRRVSRGKARLIEERAREKASAGALPWEAKLRGSLEVLRTAAGHAAQGETLKATAERIGIPLGNFQLAARERYRAEWQQELSLARSQLESLGVKLASGPCQRVRDQIRRATALAAAGLDLRRRLPRNVDPANDLRLVAEWISGDLWTNWGRDGDDGSNRSGTAGTDKVLDDPAAYMARARAAERWARANGRELFPTGEYATVRSFYESYYKPVRLADASPNTDRSFCRTIKRWTLITGDWPLKDVTVEMLARFKACLQKLRGMVAAGFPWPRTQSATTFATSRRSLRRPGLRIIGIGSAGIIPGRCRGSGRHARKSSRRGPFLWRRSANLFLRRRDGRAATAGGEVPAWRRGSFGRRPEYRPPR